MYVEFLYKHLPQTRRLTKNEQLEAANLLSLKANKKLIQHDLQVKTGKTILLKDLSNIASTFKEKDEDNLEICVKLLKEKYGASVHILADDAGNLRGLMFSTPPMREAMRLYPEFIAIDGTYKLLRIGTPVFLLLVEDSNGESEIVSVCILSSEDKESFSWFLNTFKAENPSCENIKCFMGDKDLIERDVVKSLFPGVPVLICAFHTLRTFGREITREKFGISGSQRLLILEILQKMVFCEDLEYDSLLKKLENVASQEIMDYYQRNWGNNVHEWRLATGFSCSNFLNTTNNRLESINSKLKQVIPKNSTLKVFIEKFFCIYQSMKGERNHSVALHMQKTPVLHFEPSSAEAKYCMLLTSYALSYVLKNIELSKKVKLQTCSSTSKYSVKTVGGEISVDCGSCSCRFYRSMNLPCCHIFAVRTQEGLHLYDTSICDKRWTREHYYSMQSICFPSTEESYVSVSCAKTINATSYSAKRKKVQSITNEIVNIVSLSSHVHFERKLTVLNQLLDIWAKGEEASVISLKESSEELFENSCNQNAEPYLRIDMELSVNNAEPTAADVTTQLCPVNDNVEASSNNGEPTEAVTMQLCPVDDNVEASLNDGELTEADVTMQLCPVDDNMEASLNNAELTEADVTTQLCPVGNVDASRADESFELFQIMKHLKMPQIIKRRGRPKGHDKTVIGLPKRSSRKKPVSFSSLNENEKIVRILKWFVSNDIAINAIQKSILIQEEDIECKPENVSDSVLNASVKIDLIKKYLTTDAWIGVQNILTVKQKNHILMCATCNIDIKEHEKIIMCASCLQWRHINCTGLRRTPKSKYWFCTLCYGQSKCTV